jgi:hypothetical protein
MRSRLELDKENLRFASFELDNKAESDKNRIVIVQGDKI